MMRVPEQVKNTFAATIPSKENPPQRELLGGIKMELVTIRTQSLGIG